MKLPEGYQTVMPYLILENAAMFFNFTQEVFGAVEKSRHLDDKGAVIHGEISFGDSTIMFGQATAQWDVQNTGLFIYVENADDVYAHALAKGASVVQPMGDQMYGRSGGVKDPFGNVWWITSPV
ncbi:MAG: VOC family protein [Flavisolibacter sp.]